MMEIKKQAWMCLTDKKYIHNIEQKGYDKCVSKYSNSLEQFISEKSHADYILNGQPDVSHLEVPIMALYISPHVMIPFSEATPFRELKRELYSNQQSKVAIMGHRSKTDFLDFIRGSRDDLNKAVSKIISDLVIVRTHKRCDGTVVTEFTINILKKHGK